MCWEQRTPEIIRDRFIVGINDDALMSNLVNKAVRDNSITLESVVLQAQQCEASNTGVTSLSQTTEEEVSYMKGNSQKMQQRPRNQKQPFKQNTCPWCGDTPHSKGKDDCPAKGKQCYACGRLDQIGSLLTPKSKLEREQKPISGQLHSKKAASRLGAFHRC